MEKKIEQLIANQEVTKAKNMTGSDVLSEKEYLKRIAKSTRITSIILAVFFILVMYYIISFALAW